MFYRIWKNWSHVLCLWLLVLASDASAVQAVDVYPDENGSRLGKQFELWHDPAGDKKLQDAQQALAAGEYTTLKSRDSTGLQPGAFWSHFILHNPTQQPVTLHLEYVDHQLIYLSAYERGEGQQDYQQIAELGLDQPFSHRQVVHHRFVVPVTLPAGSTKEYMFRFGSDGKGFVFPDLRIWSPDNLRYVQTKEVAINAFMSGSLLLMTLIVIAGGIATGNRMFHAYAVYAIAKLSLWPTIFGFTHQFFLPDNFHWNLMSLTSALALFAGIWFARIFLQSRRYMPRYDYILKAMLLNAGLLIFAALTKQTGLAVITVTIALLLTPMMAVAGVLRWYQGSKGAATFTVAWTFLMLGLFFQALRDLGLVEHNFVNYYWPAVASYTEMIVIFTAIGIGLRELQQKKDKAERKYLEHLELAKDKLEKLVGIRTRELENEKLAAEYEARTDALTGISNRRSFFNRAESLFERQKTLGEPFSVIMFDIDHFKQVNDVYGHAVGDQALKSFADAIKDQIRDCDVFGRIGGEEFALAMGSSADTVRQTAERLRVLVSNVTIYTPDGKLNITTSVGIANLDQHGSFEELLQISDNALYEAKNTGRNRVIFAQ